jgi:outer membrane lipase/esterase
MKKQTLFLTATLWAAVPLTSLAQRPLAGYTALYVFGDCVEATSGGPYWQGRWSNGPMWPELLSTNLGFSYRPSNNRAVGGATTFDVLNQARSLPMPASAASALFVVDIGHAEFVPYLSPSEARAWTNVARAALLNISNTVVECYRKGGRTVALMNSWDPSRSPRLARVITDPAYDRKCAREFNAGLTSLANSFAGPYPDLKIFTIDMFALFEVMVTQSAYYGFTRTDLDALGDTQLKDKTYSGPGRDYLFWDSSHLTAKAHALLVRVFLAAMRGTPITIKPESGFDTIESRNSRSR